MGEKDMEARKGDNEWATLSLRDRAEQYHKKVGGGGQCPEPEEVLGHLSIQHIASIWNCHTTVLCSVISQELNAKTIGLRIY